MSGDISIIKVAGGTKVVALGAGAAALAQASRVAIDDRIYPGTYDPASPPTTKPISGNPSADGDEFSGTDGYRYARIGGAWVNQTSAAAASASSALASEGAAAASETNSDASATAAATAQTAAEAARDAANAAGKVFADTATGLAATTNGQSFSVYSGNYIIQYRNDSGSATEVGRFYVKAFFDALLDATYGDTSDYIFAIIDSNKRMLASWKSDGTMAAKLGISLGIANGLTFTHNADGTYTLSLGTISGELPVGESTLQGSYSNTDNLWGVIDSAGRKLLMIAKDGTVSGKISSTEVVTARGDRADLNTRLSQGLTPYGDPIDPYVNRWSLREARMRLRKRAIAESVQLVIALIGDSYTQAATRFSGPLAKLLQDTYGMAGVGWVGFGWYGTASGTWTAGTQPSGLDGSVRTDLIPGVQIIGTWTCSYNVAANNTPSLSKITSSAAGDYVRLFVPSGHDTCRLFYAGDGTGVIAVSWDDGATYGANIPLTTVGAANALLTGLSTGSYLRIKVVSGNVTLAGVDLSHSTTPGVRVHKLGGSGANSTQWSGVTQGTWSAQMQALGSHVHQVLLATNDQNNITPSQLATNIGAIFTNLATVLPYSDKLIVMPAENQRTTNTTAMTAYAAAVREYAAANDCAYIDLQYFFGSPANFAFAYANANSARPWYASDLVHPDPNTGGRVMVDAEYRLLTSN